MRSRLAYAIEAFLNEWRTGETRRRLRAEREAERKATLQTGIKALPERARNLITYFDTGYRLTDTELTEIFGEIERLPDAQMLEVAKGVVQIDVVNIVPHPAFQKFAHRNSSRFAAMSRR
jgi:hypothetical protein